MNKLYVSFPNLDGVRAIAVWMVVIAHIWSSQVYDFKVFTSLNLTPLGPIAVSIFFVLSGFLITYLLLTEKNNFETINLKSFYMRRILRIWPLYFLVLIAGFALNYEEASFKGFLMCLFFAPNIAFVLHLVPYIIDPIWSIGVEEQFYIFHPLLVRKIKNNATLIFAALAIFVVSIKFVGIVFHNGYIEILRDVMYLTRFDNMFIGVIAAYMLYSINGGNQKFKIVTNKYIGFFALVGLVFYVGYIVVLDVKPIHQIIAMLVGLLLIAITDNNENGKFLSSNFMKFNGKISYGIYLLHRFPLIFGYYLASKYQLINSPQGLILLSTLTIVGTIILAYLSNKYFENYFLKKKHLYAKVLRS